MNVLDILSKGPQILPILNSHASELLWILLVYVAKVYENFLLFIIEQRQWDGKKMLPFSAIFPIIVQGVACYGCYLTSERYFDALWYKFMH